MKLSCEKLYNSKLFIALSILVFFKPGILNYLPSLTTIDNLYTVFGLLIIVIILIFRLISKKKYGLCKYILYFSFSLFFSTVINSGDVLHVFITFLNIFACCIFTEQSMDYNPKLFIKVAHRVLLTLAIINLVLLIICPNGLFITPYYHNSYHFMNTKNGFIGFILPLMVLSLLEYNWREKFSKICITLDCITCILTMILSDSTTGLLALIILFVQMIFIFNKKGFIKLFKMLIVLLTVLTLGIVIFKIQYYFSWIFEELFNKSADFTMRVDIWDVALKMIKEKPIIGYGLDISNGNILIGSTYYYSHNMILEIAVSGGLFSIVTLINIYKALFNKIKKNKITSNGLWVVLMGIICFSIISITEAPLTLYGFYMFLVIAYSNYFFEKVN